MGAISKKIALLLHLYQSSIMKKIINSGILLLFLSLCSAQLFAQKIMTSYGDKQFHQFKFKDALETYQLALKKDTANVYIQTRIADCYRLIGDHPNAEKAYAPLAANNAADPMNRFYYAQQLRYNKKYDMAGKAYESYLAYTGKPNISVRQCIIGTRELGRLQYDNGRYAIEKQLHLSSAGSDFAPAYFVNKQVILSSNRDQNTPIIRRDNWSERGFLRLYYSSSLTTQVFTDPRLVKSKNFNNKFHEGPATYCPATHELFITRSNSNKRKPETVKTKLYKVVCEPQYGFFMSEISEAVPFNSNEYSVMHPAVTADGTTMYFASDMPAPGAQGGMDIYVTRRQTSGQWGTLRNLGPDINSLGDDMYPFISGDSALYFASDGHAGLGGLDIYRSYMLSDGSWSRPKNLGAPVNTNFDDFSYVMDDKGMNGMFASDRPGGKGGDDIYSFVRKELNIVGQVIDQDTHLPVEDVKVILKEKSPESAAEDQSDRNGGFCFDAKANTQYTLSTSKLGYAARELSVFTSDKTTKRVIYITRLGAVHLLVNIEDAVTHQPINKATGVITDMNTKENAQFLTDASGIVYADIVLGHQYKIDVDKKPMGDNKYYLSELKVVFSETLVNGDTLKVTMPLHQNTVNYIASLQNIYFDLDKWHIRPDAAVELDKVLTVMKDNPAWRIQVSAYTDCRESEQYNLLLSQRRANAVVAYLTQRGISGLRLRPVGFGKTRPAISCHCTADGSSVCTEEQHQLNRRVEFVILPSDALSVEQR